MWLFKTKSPAVMPGTDKIKDDGAREAVIDINKIIQDTVRSLLDDLRNLERVERVDAIPTATLDNVGKMVIVNGTNAGIDHVFIGIDTGSGGYAFKEVTIT